MQEKLMKAIETLVQGILEYESDTWNSREAGVTLEDAEKAAANLIYNHLFDNNGCPNIDGVDVGLAVESLEDNS